MIGLARLTRTVDRNSTMKKPSCASSRGGRHNRFHHVETPENVGGGRTYSTSGAGTGVSWGNGDKWFLFSVLIPGAGTGVSWGNVKKNSK